MKRIDDWENVEEAREFEKVQPGGYICRICTAEDVESKEYLKIEYDIAEGKFAGHYQELFKAKDFWGGTLFRSYKEAAKSFFKTFISAVEKSNSGFVWDFDETKLIGKMVGLVLAEEEYVGNDGTVKERLYVSSVKSVDAIRHNDYKVPPKKLIEPSQYGYNSDYLSTQSGSTDDPF